MFRGKLTPVLKFTDPVTERETYTAAMTATIIDKRADTLTLENAVDILIRAEYPIHAIAAYVDGAINEARKYEKAYSR